MKPGRWVYVPTPLGRARGEEIRKQVSSVWKPPAFYFHLRQGGHVAALQSHVGNRYFFRGDIQDFFGRVNRSRVTRGLKKYFSYAKAREMAGDSVVVSPTSGNTMLPFGFVQSPLLASLVLDESRVGRWLAKSAGRPGLKVSVYVDDILLSSHDKEFLRANVLELEALAGAAGLPLNALKSEGPADLVTAFNIELTNGNLAITPERIEFFREAYSSAVSSKVEDGILGYVASVNPTQVASVTV